MEIIHIVLGKANPDRLNGVNKVVNNLASDQVRAGKNIQVWGISKDLHHDYPVRNFRTRLFKAGRFPFAVPLELKRAILDHTDAVFHLHGGWIPLFSSLSWFFSKHGVKYVLTPHGAYNSVAMRRSYWKKRIYFLFFEKHLLKCSYKVHSIGRSEVDGLQQLFSAANSFLLPYGFYPNISLLESPKDDVFTFGFVGRLDTYTKGLDLQMEAFFQFQSLHPKSRMWIIGDGDGMAYLNKYISDHNLENVVLWGKKFNEEKDELIGRMHVFLHPSRNEGLPTSVLEAASMGIPSIVSLATNVADYVTKYKAGKAVNNDSISELLVAMNELYTEYQCDQLESYRKGTRNMLESAFAWPALVGQFDELYS